MRKSLAIVLSICLILTGLALEVIATMNGPIGSLAQRSRTVYPVLACFFVLLLLGLVFPAFAESDYSKVLRVMLGLSALGMFLIYVFLGFMWMFAGRFVMSVLVAAFLVLYGIALVMLGVFNYFASQGGYRPFIYSIARELPYIYYRYRI
jgi:hypothetical protein